MELPGKFLNDHTIEIFNKKIIIINISRTATIKRKKRKEEK